MRKNIIIFSVLSLMLFGSAYSNAYAVTSVTQTVRYMGGVNGSVTNTSDITTTGNVNMCSMSGISNFKDLVNKVVICYLKYIIRVLVAIAVIIFLFGVFKFIIYSDNLEDKKKGKNFMIWGVIGIFVMVSLWGLVNVFRSTFKLDNTTYTPSKIDITNLK